MRSVPEWIGATDDTAIPPRVRARVFLKFGGICQECGIKIIARRWICDHEKALVNGGENRESNLRPIHEACDKIKTALDVGEKKIVFRKRNKWLGIKKNTARPMIGSRASGWKKTFNKGWVRRTP